MKVEQEPKYDVRDDRIVNRVTGEPIPDDEPVIFRAKDRYAAHVLRLYVGECLNAEHRQAILHRAYDFERFAHAHPERMKEPDTTPGERGE
jgi:hypothetical protein